jgi:hypothetical protein
MSMRIGVVCEGSHDFNVLRHFIDVIVREAGETVDSIDCLQPLVSATFQESGGGWTQVKSWCERQGGQWYRSYLDQPLFATSKNYDILVVHLDGDVVTHCSTPPINDNLIDDTAVEDAIDLLKSAILHHWLQPEPEHLEKIIVCAPVRHIEAWLSVIVGPQVDSPEDIDMKDLFRAGPAEQIAGETWREKYITAARIAVVRHREIETSSTSYRLFRSDLTAAAQAA